MRVPTHVEYGLGPIAFEPERQFTEVGTNYAANRVLRPKRHVEQKETAPTCPCNLSAYRSGSTSTRIEVIDFRISDPISKLSLQHPTFMEELAERVKPFGTKE